MKSFLEGVKGISFLERNLDLRALKHLQIVSNLANSSNPNYKAFEVVLDKALQSLDGNTSVVSMTLSNSRHLAPGGSQPGGVELRPKVVSFDEEMTRLIQNHLTYNASAEILSRQFRILKAATR